LPGQKPRVFSGSNESLADHAPFFPRSYLPETNERLVGYDFMNGIWIYVTPFTTIGSTETESEQAFDGN
jgi:hypothetical protein